MKFHVHLRFLSAVLLFCGSLIPLSAQSVGGGISFFVPESLVTGSISGSVSKEAGLSTSLGLGDIISIPVGFTYIKASGIMAYEENEEDNLNRIDDEMWYTADTFIPYLRLKAHIPAGPLFVEGFAGVAGAWFVAPQMNEAAIGRGFADLSGEIYDLYAFEDLSLDISFGYGFQLGGSIGVQIDAIRVQLTGVFTDLRAETTASSDTYYKIDYDNLVSSTEEIEFEEKFVSRLRGMSIGLGGSFQM